MRVLSWNVNGIKTLLQYHPWNACKTYEGIMEELGADIICLQETKITRTQMDKSLACMPAFDSFFSFYRRTPPKGIHGTAIVTKRSVCVPLKAEEGIGVTLIPPLTREEDRIGGYPDEDQMELDEEAMRDLDLEGRTTVCDFGMFVLINLYCPHETNEERLVFKNYFNAMVELRVRNLIKAGRQVIVAGDLNACWSNLDTAEPEMRAKEQGIDEFTDHAPRKWLRNLVSPTGPLVDITRRLHPTRERMYTCWNTKIDARPSNYGSRIDYVLLSHGLLPWVKDSDILPSIMGSDHCPVFVDFFDEIDLPGRGRVLLRDELLSPAEGETPRDAPAFAARNWDEYSGKQKLLSSFFGKKPEGTDRVSASAPQPVALTSAGVVRNEGLKKFSASQPAPIRSTSASLFKPWTGSQPANISLSSSQSSSNGKGKGKEQEAPAAQPSISSFFKPPPKPKPMTKVSKRSSSTTATPELKKRAAASASASTSTASSIDLSASDEEPSQDAPYDWRGDESMRSDSFAAVTATNEAAAAAWTSLFTPRTVPLCKDHQEPSRLWTVMKPGINKGRRFYLCSRPVGPGYDKGQAKLHVNPEYRCNFFEWETSVKRPAAGATTTSLKKQKT